MDLKRGPAGAKEAVPAVRQGASLRQGIMGKREAGPQKAWAELSRAPLPKPAGFPTSALRRLS